MILCYSVAMGRQTRPKLTKREADRLNKTLDELEECGGISTSFTLADRLESPAGEVHMDLVELEARGFVYRIGGHWCLVGLE
jgi:predicted Rossmann fold nucleotide-binding protein DprA/Smf involved in DNA uptake